MDGVRTTLNLEDLALYFVNPEKQKLGTGSRSGIYRFRKEYLVSLDIEGSIPGKAVLTAQTIADKKFRKPVLLSDANLVDAFHTASWSNVTPITYVVDAAGVIRFGLRGAQTREAIDKALEAAR